MDVVEPETMSSALKVKDKEAGDVGKFLNRILGLSVQRQNLVCSFLLLQQIYLEFLTGPNCLQCLDTVGWVSGRASGVVNTELVSWSLTSLFSTNMAISETDKKN